MCEQKATRAGGEIVLIFKWKPTKFYHPLANNNCTRTTVASCAKSSIHGVVTKLLSKSTFFFVTI